MFHQQRWTLPQIEHRLTLITPLVYRQRVTLPPFCYQPFPRQLWDARDIIIYYDGRVWLTEMTTRSTPGSNHPLESASLPHHT